MSQIQESLLNNVNTYSSPSDLKITDVRFVDLLNAPMHCILVKIYTNQGLVGIGEVRDNSSRTYAAMLKGRLLGENPCNVDKIFQRLKQFNGPGRQGGGVSGIEIALWDLAGKAYGVPIYAMLGGKFRENVRVYCDLGEFLPPSLQYKNEERLKEFPKKTGHSMGTILKRHIDDFGFTMVKASFTIPDFASLYPNERVFSAPDGYVKELIKAHHDQHLYSSRMISGAPDADFTWRNNVFHMANTQSPYRMMRFTEHGLDRFEKEVADMCAALDSEVPVAIDVAGCINLEDAGRLMQRLEKYSLAWLEDILPCTFVEEYKRLSQMSCTPLATGEDLSLVEGFEPLCRERAVALIHPDLCSSGGILETKRIGEMAERYNVGMVMHMCETPVAALATAHMGLATKNFIAMEFNAPYDTLWESMLVGYEGKIIRDGFIEAPLKPGLGFDDLNDEVLKEYLSPYSDGLWKSTEQWDAEYSNDRLWS